jgi:hypothetical protein
VNRIFRLSHLTPSEALVLLIVILIGVCAAISLGIRVMIR